MTEINVELLVARDPATVVAYWEEGERRIRPLVQRKVGRHADQVDDLVFETLTRALADLPSRDPATLKLWPWTRTIAINLIIDEQRRPKVASLDERYQSGDDTRTPPGLAVEPDILDGYIEREAVEERNERVGRVMDKLPEDLARILVLQAGGHTYAEIGEDLGITVQDVKSRADRARQLARSAWAEGDPR